ncbi:MAG: oxygenase MpaB family protein [Segniliparus sp.]|uniref:oxygenase MpaB family protein n=1 Tax=Segniliparus sp. TaxID=2804064 RepID=UPI003F2A198E
MTAAPGVRKNADITEPRPSEDLDLLAEDQQVHKNVFYAGSCIPDLPGDDSIPRKAQEPIPIPADSLIWKYLADVFFVAAPGARAAVLQSLFPQTAQGVSEHSQLLNSSNYRDIVQRGINSIIGINKVVYSSPEVAKKYGIQLRNYHKSIKGDMPNGRAYHALNAETWYFTHATFFENIYRASDLGVLRKPLTWEEKEQIFEESKLWYSLMGVDDRVQPETYAEFEQYWQRVYDTQLFRNKMSDYNFVAARGGQFDKLVAPRYRKLFRVFAPAVQALVRVMTVGPLEPALREKMQVQDIASPGLDRTFRALVWAMKWAREGMRVARVPLKYRYAPFAVEAFERAGVHPDDITLESARAALRKAREEGASVRSLSTADVVAETPADAACAKCLRQLEPCVECAGSGHSHDEVCDVCDGIGRGCRVHHNDWREEGRGLGVGLEDKLLGGPSAGVCPR